MEYMQKISAVFCKECWVLNFWVLYFYPRGLCFKSNWYLFYLALFIQTNERVVHLIVASKARGKVC